MGGWRPLKLKQASAGMSTLRWAVGKGLGSMPGEAVLYRFCFFNRLLEIDYVESSISLLPSYPRWNDIGG